MDRAAEGAARGERPARGKLTRRTYPVAAHLALFAIGTLTPVLLIVGYMLFDTARLWRADALQDSKTLAHHLSATVDIELEKAIAIGQTLAASYALTEGDFTRFDAQAREVANRLGVVIAARDLTGQQVTNTAVPRGTPLPVSNAGVLATDRLAAARQAPVVSDLVIGTVLKTPFVIADIPISRDGEVRYFVNVALFPHRLVEILSPGLPDGWLVGLVGADGRLIARTQDQDRYIGTTNPKFLEATTGTEGVWSGTSRDGIPISGFYVRSPLSQWRLSVAVPETLLQAPIRRAMAALGGVIAAALLVSIWLGLRFSRRISRPIRDLVAQAKQVGEGRVPADTRSELDEVNEVTVALRAASAELDRRKAEANRAAEAVRQNEERLQMVQDSAGIGTVDWDIQRDRAVCSSRFYEIYALPPNHPAAFAGLIERVHPADRPRIKELRRRLFAEGGAFEDEFRILTPTGGERWIHVKGRVDLKNGRPSRLLGANTDISILKRNARALLASEARFRGIFENAAVGVALVGLDGAFILINQRLCEIVGYEHHQLMARPLTDLIHPADLADDRALHGKLLSGELDTFSTEERFVRQDGETIWCRLTVSMQPHHEGAPRNFIAVVRDVTVRKRTQDELQERLREIEALYDNAPVGLTVLDRDRRYLRINRALAEINGLPVESHVGRFAWDVVPALKESLDAKIAEVLETGQTVEFELSGETPRQPGITRFWHEKLYPILQSDGNVKAVGITVEEITERKRSEQHLRFLLREISHRSKNLLAVIQAMATQTAKASVTVDDFRRRFGERLMGLAASHDLLVNQDWTGVSVRNLVRGQVSPFVDVDDPRLQLRGPDLILKAETAEALGLALHELATNAMKHGALKEAAGKIEIVWDVDEAGAEGPRFRMDWIEHAPFRVSPPSHRGFGRIVIEHTVQATFNGKVTLTFPPDGLRWHIDAPATCLAPVSRSMAD